MFSCFPTIAHVAGYVNVFLWVDIYVLACTVGRVTKEKSVNVALPEKVHRRIKVSAAKRGVKIVDRTVELIGKGFKTEGEK